MARIVFDLDGTLIDSAPDLRAVANEVLDGEGAEPVTLEDTYEFIGNGTPVFVARMRAARGIPDSEQDRLLAAFLDRYDGAVGLTRPYSGVVDALGKLFADHALGICTNKPHGPALSVLNHFGLASYFSTVIGGDSLPEPKPDPAPLHAAFDALGAGPRLYVGDSEVDAETAERAGVAFLLHTGGYLKSRAEDVQHAAGFGRFADLPGIVEAALKRV